MSQEAFEAVNQETPPSLTLFLILEGFGLSLMNRSAVEVVYFSTKSLKLEYTTSEVSQSVNLSIGHIQIDNQLPEATFQVVLQPSPLPSRRTGPPLPAVQCSVILLNDRCMYQMTSSGMILTLGSSWCHIHQVCFHIASKSDNYVGRGFLDGNH